jgi:hypothetical protein
VRIHAECLPSGSDDEGDSDIVWLAPSVVGHGKWMKAGWARENEQ